MRMLAVDKHDGEGDRQQSRSYGNRMQAQPLDTPVSQDSAHHEAQDDTKIECAVF